MDRFSWLDAQKGWIRSWQGCLACAACKEDRFIFCDKIKWLFQGYASFHVNLRKLSDSGSIAPHGPCSAEAAHLFFATHSTLSDPAQLALRVGILMERPEEIQAISVSDIRYLRDLFLFSPSKDFAGLNIPRSAILMCGLLHHPAVERRTWCLHLTIQAHTCYKPSETEVEVWDDHYLYCYRSFLFLTWQVENVSFWQQESGCLACQGQEVTREEGSEKIHACACQQVPSHITVNLQHVALNVYADEQFNERPWNTMSLSQIMEVLDKILQEQKLKSMMDNTTRQAEASCMEQEELPAEAKDILNHSNMLLQKYLNDIDCVSECALKAVEVCRGDPRWMGRMLFIMAQHSAHQRLNLSHLQTLKGFLNCRLVECLEKEKLEIEKAWKANSCQFMQQQMQCHVTSSLEHLQQERKCIEEALLWVELVCTGLSL